MKTTKPSISRRALIKSSIFGAIAVSIPNIFYAKNIINYNSNDSKLFVATKLFTPLLKFL